MIWVFAAVILFLAVWIFLVFPGRKTREQKAPFTGRAYAHRGLYEEDQSIPEPDRSTLDILFKKYSVLIESIWI